MNRRTYWILGILTILITGIFVFVYIKDQSEIRELEKGLSEAEKLEKKIKQQPVEKVDRKLPDEPDLKSVQRNDDLDKVPITGAEQKPDPVQQPMNTYKNNGEYIEIDYSVFDGDPKELIRKHSEIRLNRGKYSPEEYDRTGQEAMILFDKIREGYYGTGEYQKELEQFADEVYWDPVLKTRGLSVVKLQQMIRGEIPPRVVPIDPAVLDTAIDGGDK